MLSEVVTAAMERWREGLAILDREPLIWWAHTVVPIRCVIHCSSFLHALKSQLTL